MYSVRQTEAKESEARHTCQYWQEVEEMMMATRVLMWKGEGVSYTSIYLQGTSANTRANLVAVFGRVVTILMCPESLYRIAY